MKVIFLTFFSLFSEIPKKSKKYAKKMFFLKKSGKFPKTKTKKKSKKITFSRKMEKVKKKSLKKSVASEFFRKII